MSNILVAVDESRTNAHVIEAAIEHAERDGGSLVVVHVMPSAVYRSKQRAVDRSRELRQDGFTFTISQARAAAEGIADREARTAIGDRDVPHVAIGAVGELGPVVRDVAAAHDCATVLLAAERSWWRRRLGLGDRRLTKHFDGAVVRVPRPRSSLAEPEQPLPEA